MTFIIVPIGQYFYLKVRLIATYLKLILPYFIRPKDTAKASNKVTSIRYYTNY